MSLAIHDVRRAVKKFLEFFDIDDLELNKFVAPVTGRFYVQILKRLRYAVQRKRHGQLFQHHDNAPSHTSLVEQQFLARKSFPSSLNHLTLRISLRVILAVLYSENWLQGGMFQNNGGQ
jgi:hypothetical protein